MHAPLQQLIETEQKTWRGGVHYFNSARAAEWIQNFNATQDTESLNRLLKHVEPFTPVPSFADYARRG
jgi:hypothetical protein